MSERRQNCSSSLKLFIRQRPLSTSEMEQRCRTVVHSIYPHEVVLQLGRDERRYVCDYAFGPNSTQSEVFDKTLVPMIKDVISGYNCTFFAYGGPRTGKTYTIFGDISQASTTDWRQDNSAGLILRASQYLFTNLSNACPKTEYSVRISCIELYNEELRDLFSNSSALSIYDDPLVKGSVCMRDVNQVTVFNTRDVLDWLNIAWMAHQRSVLKYNIQESRSHMIFTFLVNTREVTAKGDYLIKSARLCLMDLAGNKKVITTDDLTRSAQALPMVITTLARRSQQVPYEISNLTRLLQSSLEGNTKTCMMVTFSPLSKCWDETLLSLNISQYARNIVTCVNINVNRKHANVMQELDDMINRLRSELAAAKRSQGVVVSSPECQKMTYNSKEGEQNIIDHIEKISLFERHRTFIDLEYRSLEKSFKSTKVYVEEVFQRSVRRQKKNQPSDAVTTNTVVRDTPAVVVANATSNNINTQDEDGSYPSYPHHSIQTWPQMMFPLDAHQQLPNPDPLYIMPVLTELWNYVEALYNYTSQDVLHIDQIVSEMRDRSEDFNAALNQVSCDYSNDAPIISLQYFMANIHRRHFLMLQNQWDLWKLLEAVQLVQEVVMRTLNGHFVYPTAEANGGSADGSPMDRETLAILMEENRNNEVTAIFTRHELARAEQERRALLNHRSALEVTLANITLVDDTDEFVPRFPDDFQPKGRKIVNTELMRANEALEQRSAEEGLRRGQTNQALNRVENIGNLAQNQAVAVGNLTNGQATEMVPVTNQGFMHRNGVVTDVMHTWRSTFGGERRNASSNGGETNEPDDISRRFSDVVKINNTEPNPTRNSSHQGNGSTRRSQNHRKKSEHAKYSNNNSKKGKK